MKVLWVRQNALNLKHIIQDVFFNGHFPQKRTQLKNMYTYTTEKYVYLSLRGSLSKPAKFVGGFVFGE